MIPVRADILTEHSEEIEILWSRRRAVLWSPRETLDTLAALERRLDAHIDGLALDVDGAHECFERGLTGEDTDAAFASAVTLLRQRTMSSLNRVLDALGTAKAPARKGLGEALAYEPLAPMVEQRLQDLLVAEPDSPAGHVARRILRAHGRGPAAEAESSLVELRSRCAGPIADRVLVCRLGCLGESSDVELLAMAAMRSDLAEAAVRALGSLGVVEAVEALLGLMSRDGTAPAAAEAFRRITGLPPVPREDAPAADGDEHFEETRPWPDAARTRALWEQHSPAFAGGGRWRYGQPLDARRWLVEPHAGDLLTRREEITRLRHEDRTALADLDLDAPAARQRLWSPSKEENP